MDILDKITKPFRKPEGYVSAKEEAAAAKAAAAPAPAPAPQLGGVNLGVMGRREKAAGLKDGGPVAGPGTGTSDSIPAKLSDGEYVIPADSVQAIGVDVLDAMVAATHKPTDQPAATPGGVPMLANGGMMRGKKCYADGGLVTDEDEEKRGYGVPATGGAVFGMYPSMAGTRMTSHAMDAQLRTGVTAAGTPPPEVVRSAQQALPAGVQPSTAGAGRGSAASFGVPTTATAAAPPVAPRPVAPPPVVAPTANPTDTMGASVAPGGVPSAANIGAVDAIIGRQRAEQGVAAAPAAPASLPAGYGATIPGNAHLYAQATPGTAEYNAIRSAEMTMTKMAGEANKKGVAYRPAAEAAAGAYRGAAAAPVAQAEAAARDTAALTRTQMTEAGATGRDAARLGVQAAIDNRRVAVTEAEAAQRLGVGKDVQAAAKQLTTLQARFAAATDPKERERLREEILLRQGKDRPDGPNRYTPIRGGQVVGEGGQIINVPDRVLDNQTGRYVEQGAAQPAAGVTKAEYDKLPKGSRYVGPDGKTYTKG
jgi:hypothetical protein